MAQTQNGELHASEHPDRFYNRVATLVGTTCVVWFFSEMYFLNEGAHFYAWSQRESVTSLLANIPAVYGELMLFYVFFVLWLLMAVAYFRVRTVWALTFAALVCGWAIEGSIVPIMYHEMPMALLFPAATWHVVMNVIIGWWLLRKLITCASTPFVLGVFAIMGAWWSLWATWFWPVGGGGTMEDYTLPMPPSDFSYVAWFSSLLLMIGYVLIDRYGGGAFTPGRKGTLAFFVLGSALTLLGSQVFAPIYFALVGIAVFFLWCNKKVETRPNILSSFRGKAPLLNYLSVLAMPLVASALYLVWYHHSISLNQYHGFVLWPFILASMLFIGYSGYRVLRRA